jgi:hypothetical protein
MADPAWCPVHADSKPLSAHREVSGPEGLPLALIDALIDIAYERE